MELGRPISVGFVVDKEALVQAFSPHTCDHPSQFHSTIAPYMYVFSSNIDTMTFELFVA